MFRLTYSWILCFCVALSAVTSYAEIVDPDGPRNDVLSRIANQLDGRGVDVRFGSNAGTTNPARPQLTPLSTFRTSAPIDFRGSTFVNSFARGIAFESALFAVDSRTGIPFSDPERFQSRWSDVSSNNRVFISFSSADEQVARQISLALNASGYSTFIYTGSDASGRFNAIDTGNYFRQAGHRFVVDTANSRSSIAVAAEAMFARYPDRLNNWGSPLGGGDSESQFGCCQLCTYRNGVLIGCGQTVCGEQCRDAR